jgi:uncharacterized protein
MARTACNASSASRLPRPSSFSMSLPLMDRDAPRGARAADGRLATTFGGEPVELLADRALYWPRERTLFVADVHLGKGATFRAGGVPIPRGTTAHDLARLARLIEATQARTLVVLGDFLHAAAGRVDALDHAFRDWRSAQRDIVVKLVRGNHDERAGDPPLPWRIDVVEEPHALPPFLACHRPHVPPSGYALCGHVHPGVWVTGRARESARLPCFLLGPRRLLMPAFGRMTGLATIAPEATERVIVIAGGRLFELPR